MFNRDEYLKTSEFKVGDIVTPRETKGNAAKIDFHEKMTGHTSALRPGTIGIVESVYLVWPSSRIARVGNKPKIVYVISWEAENGTTKTSHRVSKSAIKIVK
jgi:hypothetical protein